MAEILVTGGAGFIGSHMCVELLDAGHGVVVLDNLSNSSSISLERVQQLTQKSLQFVRADLRDVDALRVLFANHDIKAVIHFAGLKAVGESVEDPLTYYDNNVNGTMRLLEAMIGAKVKTIVFSSSATVYGLPDKLPICESSPTNPINPYGRTKLHIEEMLKDLFASDPSWRISLLRYFNPVGAHSSGKIGEHPEGVPNNLLPFVSQVAVGSLERLKVFGCDYETPDGTGIRDYIHVVDLVRGHLKALDYLAAEPKLAVHNLGTGNGHSVLEVIRAFEAASGREIPYELVERRAGDAASSFADPAKANVELDWKAEYGLEKMCEDVWRWQSNNPDGYG